MNDLIHRVRVECQHKIPITGPDGNVIYVGCGRCPVCRKRRSNDWFVRLKYELQNSESAYFVTLTYDDDHLPWQEIEYFVDKDGHYCSPSRYSFYHKSRLDVSGYVHVSDFFPCLNKVDVQLFVKRLRKRLGYTGIKYFLCSEYGPNTLRPHYHAVFYNLPCTNDARGLYDLQKLISDCWTKGFVSVAKVNDNRLRYLSKYCTAQTYLPPVYYSAPELKPFSLMSKGLGKCFVELFPETVRILREAAMNGTPIVTVRLGQFRYSIPRYLSQKIFDDEMRLKIADYCKQCNDDYLVWYHDNYFDYDCSHDIPMGLSVYNDFVAKSKSRIKRSRYL